MLLATVPGAPGSAGAEATFTTWVPTGRFESSSFERVPYESDQTTEAAPTRLHLSAVRNAPVSAQLAVTAHRDLQNLTVDVLERPLPGETRPLPRNAVTVRYPDFVPVEGTDQVTADPLRTEPPDVPAGTNQPIWFTVDIPASLRPGSYSALLQVRADGIEPVVHELMVDVADVTISDPGNYDFYLNMWFQPDAVAYAHDVPVHSERHWELLDPYLRDLASRGQKVINAAIVEDPWEIGWPDGTWRAQTFYPFHSLVDWSYDGESWDFGYAAFDRYVEASRRAGIGPDIRVYALLMFGGRERLFYHDDRTGEMVREVVQLGDARWRQAWAAFLADFEEHLRERGWFDDTMLAFDERPSSTMRVVQDFLAESAPAFADKVHIAVHTLDVDHTIPDISYAIGLLAQLDKQLLERRREAGHLTTFYTTGGPWTPNTITATPPVGARLLGWIPQRYGLDGYLRWSYNSWPSDDPFTDPAYRYAQGDEYIVYPGAGEPMSSIRWETFRDGVVDHELLNQLARRAGENNPAYQQALAMVDPHSGPSSQLYEDVLEARRLVVAELERLRDLEVNASAAPSTVVAGEQVEVVVAVSNDGRTPLMDLTVGVPEQDGWTVERVEGGHVEHLKPGDTFESRFAVTAPETAPTGTVNLTAGLSLRRVGVPVSLEVPVPVEVQGAVGVTGFTAEPGQVQAGEPVTLTAQVVNRRAQVTSPTISVTAPEGWEVEPAAHQLDLEAHGQRTVNFTARPTEAAASGLQRFTAAVAVAGEVVETARATTVYNEVALDGVTVYSVSSEELVGEDGAADNLLDRDPLTIWHSRWFDSVAQPPHEVVLDLDEPRTVHALKYLPRQTGTLNGTVKDYEIYVGNDPSNWGAPVTTGTFAGSRDEKRADFNATRGRYIRFLVLSEQSGQPFASGAELTLMGAP
jgi:sialidase-1